MTCSYTEEKDRAITKERMRTAAAPYYQQELSADNLAALSEAALHMDVKGAYNCT